MLEGHTSWLDLCTRFPDVYLREHHEAYRALQLLPRPDSQTPQLITLIGGQRKSSFITECFPLKNTENHKKILLRTVPRYYNTEAPLIVADCELHNSPAPTTILNSTRPTSAIETHSLKWLRNLPRIMGANTLPHLVYAKLLLPFSTAVGIFASDFAGTGNVATFLASWIGLRNRQPISPPSTFARVFIFVPWRECVDEKLATKELIKQVRSKIPEEKGIYGSFGDKSLLDVEFERLLKESAFELRVLALPDIGETPHLDTFWTRLLCESEEIHDLRKAARVAYSARHYQAFLQLACRHFGETIVFPFNFVDSSRIPNPVPLNFSLHLARFLTCVADEHQDILSTTVASALYLDGFPPGAHVFDESLIFETLYSKILKDAFKAWPDCENFIKDIKNRFCKKQDGANTAWLHKQLLQCFSDVWKSTFCNLTCLSCLARAPNFVLPCKHSFCDTCVVIHGKRDLEEPWNFHFDYCPLCNAHMQTAILLKPRTAGVRCVVLDSGSYSDFEMLDTLQKALGLPMNIGEYFDIINRSSVGAWLILEKFCSFKGCRGDNFYQKAKLNAPEQSPGSSRFSNATLSSSEVALRRLEGALKSVPRWSSKLQSSIRFTSSLNAIFAETTLVEYRQGSTKLCITVTRSKDGATCVLSNYIGDIERPISYKHIRERKSKNEIQLSQCARISLTTKSVHGYQAKERGLQDEMIKITIAEQDIIWGRKGRTPDILLALGACIPRYDQDKSTVNPEWLADFRLRNDMLILQHSVDALLASLFYIELIDVPQLNEAGRVFCKALVRCRIPPSSSAYRILVEKMWKCRARFYCGYWGGPCVNRQLYDEVSRGIAFSRRIEMSLQSLQHSIDVKIDGITKMSQSISNCPYKLQQLIEDQGLHCVFGDKDHSVKYFGSIQESQARPI